jgi:hypothetical protein
MLNRSIEMLKLDGTLFTQSRTVPRGSNWPANFLNSGGHGVPRPATIGTRRRSHESRANDEDDDDD